MKPSMSKFRDTSQVSGPSSQGISVLGSVASPSFSELSHILLRNLFFALLIQKCFLILTIRKHGQIYPLNCAICMLSLPVKIYRMYYIITASSHLRRITCVLLLCKQKRTRKDGMFGWMTSCGRFWSGDRDEAEYLFVSVDSKKRLEIVKRLQSSKLDGPGF